MSGAIGGVIRARDLRNSYFPSHLFADPAWDILLDLAASRLRGRCLKLTAIGLGGNVPDTTARRVFAELDALGLVTRAPEPGHRRRVLASLSDDGAARMAAWAAAL